MISVEQLLTHFCRKPNQNIDLAHRHAIDSYGKIASGTRNVRVESRRYGVYGIAHFFGLVDKGPYKLVEYVPNKEIRTDSNRKMRGPLSYINDTDLSYYGLKLNILAEIIGQPKIDLVLICSPEGKTYYIMRNRSVSQSALEYYTSKISHSGRKEFFIDQTQYSLAI